MAEVIHLRDLTNGYIDLVEHVRDTGKPSAPRGQEVRELHSVTIEVEDSNRCVPVGVGRRLNLGILAAETAHLIGGVSDLKQMVSVSPTFARFANGDYLRGAYGPRAHQQWTEALRRLEEDPDTRQAVVSIWNGQELKSHDTRDLPCTVALTFALRDGRLNAHTFMRSNDVWLGVPYDFGMFTMAQHCLAAALGVESGSYTHTAVNLHLYERDVEKTYELKRTDTEPEQPPAPSDGFYGSVETPQQLWTLLAQSMVDAALGREQVAQAGFGARWYADRLAPHVTDGLLHPWTRYVTGWSDDE